MKAPVVLRRLDQKDPADLRALQRVLEGAPGYSTKVSGEPVSLDAAREAVEALPPGFDSERKYVFGVQVEGTLVGCIDALRGFPNEETLMLGLLLIQESHQGFGFGRRALAALEEIVREWPEIRKIRIGVVLTNSGVLSFWRGLGFSETGERRPYENGRVVSENLILEKILNRF